MNKKALVVFANICVFLLLGFIIFITYNKITYGNTIIPSDEKLSEFKELTEIYFTDTSNLSFVNAIPGQTITKSFSIKNISDKVIYYDILFDNVVNNFNEPNDLRYSLSSVDGGGSRNDTVLPTVTGVNLVSRIKINPNEKHSYTMNTIFNKSNVQNLNINKTFSSNISIVPSDGVNFNQDLYEHGTLIYNLLVNEFINSEGIIDYNILDKEGLFYTNNSIDGKTLYFYRGGNNLKNNVIFAGNCWKIVRTTYDDGVRLLYNGKVESGVCNNNKSDILLDELSEFNSYSTHNAYVGFMYGTPSSSSYNMEHSNKNPSKISTLLKTWYNNNLSDYVSYIDDSIYCNNRKTVNFTLKGVSYDILGYGNNNTGYLGMKNSLLDINPSYDCVNISDRLSVGNKNGVSVLSSPIGLLTSDEFIFAGGGTSGDIVSYLYSNNPYWTMTPAYYNGVDAYNFSINKNKLVQSVVTSKLGIRPVITLKANVKVMEGIGSLDKPYVITE